MQFLYQEIS